MQPYQFFRSTVSLLSVMALSAGLTACGGGGSSSTNVSAPTSPASQITTLNGMVNKGVVRNGLVSVYSLKDGAVDTLLGTTYTDQSGHYSLNITNYDGPVYIQVSPSTNGKPTLMVCDAAAGCGTYSSASSYDTNNNGTIDFGETFEVPANFELTSALPSASLSSSATISTLTHLATQLAAQYPQGLNDISIAVAMSQVQNLFGLDSSPATLKTVDLTNTTAVSGATDAQLRYSLLASSLMGTTNDAALGDTINALTTQFESDNGQLVQRDNDPTVPSFLDLVDQALATAQKLNLSSQISTLQQTQTTLASAQVNSLTSAQASPGAGGEASTKIQTFIADLQLWQGYLSLDPTQTSFAQMVSTMGVSTGADLSHMLQAVAIAGQYGPIVALPNLALGAACDSLGNALAQLTCHILIAGKSLQDICEGSLNLVIFNRSLCDILNDLTVPLGANLYGHFALYDGVARIYGTLDNADVDLTFTASSHTSSRYGFDVTGTVKTDQAELTINSGNVSAVFDGGLDIRNLKLPTQASGNLDVSYQQYVTDTNPDSMSFDGTVAISLDLSNVRSSSGSYSGLDQAGVNLTANGSFQSAQGGNFTGSIGINGGLNSNVVLQFTTDLPDYSSQAQITLTSSPAHLSTGVIDDIRIAWDGKQYDIMNFTGTSNDIRITNQDGIIMDLDTSVQDGSTAGYILLNGVRYGTVTPLNGSLQATLADGSQVIL